MAFASLHDFIQMGNHGFYVWLAFIVSIALMKFLFWNPFIQQRKCFREIRQTMQREATRQGRPSINVQASERSQ